MARGRPRATATFCLIHGAWHDGSCWESVATALRARGHEVVTPDLPLHDRAAGFGERAAPAIEALSGAADPVVVVGHSMGSAYATLTAAATPASLLVHLCGRLGGFAEPAGAPPRFREGFEFPPDRPDGTRCGTGHGGCRAVRAWDAETARRLTRDLHPMAQPPDDFPLTGPPDVGTALVYAADDEFFEPDWERFMAREVLGVEPIEIPGGHFPMAEDPEGLANLLDRLAPDVRRP